MSIDLNDNEINEVDDFSSHEYDGIKELNNKAPTWIVLIFLVTIGFAGIYTIKYFGYPDNKMDQTSEYNQKMKTAKEKMAGNTSIGSDTLNIDEMVSAGETLYLEKGCIACHGTHGEGNQIGPNLTDNFWIHGCKPDDIVNMITEGKPEKGMTPYKNMMSESQIKNLSAFILNKLVGSNPENEKASQGIECKN